MKVDSHTIIAGDDFFSPTIIIQSGSVIHPIISLRRPKWISRSEFNRLIKHLHLDLPTGYEIKDERSES